MNAEIECALEEIGLNKNIEKNFATEKSSRVNAVV